MEALAEVFRAAGRAHHEAFPDDDDPDWALWYADHVREAVNSGLGRDLSTIEIADLFRRAEARRAPDEDWPVFYAEFFLEL